MYGSKKEADNKALTLQRTSCLDLECNHFKSVFGAYSTKPLLKPKNRTNRFMS